MEKTILVLGGGIGGIRTARELNKQIGNDEDVTLAKILVFDKLQTSLFAPSLTWMMVGKREMYQIQDDLDKIEVGGIEVVIGDIEAVDPNNLTVTSGGREYKGDYMVVSLGAAQEDYLKLDEVGFNFYTAEGASGFHEQLKQFDGGKIAIVVSTLPYKSPVAPYEAAMLVDSYLREKGIREKSEITLFSPEKAPMTFAGEDVSKNVLALLDSKDINYKSEHELVDTGVGALSFKTNGKKVIESFDLMAFTPKHVSPQIIQKAGLTGSTDWVDVNEKTLETKFPKVYAIGDITNIPLNEHETLPKAGVFAQYQAATVAHNIVRDIHGLQPDQEFKPEGKYILEQGDGKASSVGGNFYSSEIEINSTSAIQHWVKILHEKSWFAKNF